MNRAESYVNPINVALGRLLQQARQDRGIRNAAEAARTLGIAASTYRMVEAGRLPMPPYCAPALATLLDLPVTRVAAALAIVGSLNDPSMDAPTLRTRARSLAALDSNLAWVSRALDAWLAAQRDDVPEPRRLAAEQAVIAQMTQVLRGAGVAPIEAKAPGGLALAAESLQPIFHDALEDWIGQQSMLAPVLPFDGLLGWLDERAPRVRRVRASVTEPLGVVHLAHRQATVTALLRNPHAPEISIVVGHETADAIGTAVRSIMRAAAESDPHLNRGERELRKRQIGRLVRVVAGDRTFMQALAPVLHAPVPGNAAALSAGSGARQFRDLWLVDYLTTGTSAPQHLRRVGFITLYERVSGSLEPRSGYAVALDARNGDLAVEQFDRQWARLTEK